ncbi:hypothetical protein OC846_001390 [Tilletia horrida]|uniref:Cell division cycle protein 123 n=1 Tax=Tilletia horrida TaxID=155126 RepID=A0AAN6GV96_9BASI|nr:hypothetical protein OC845_003340 [Tilletia horrida]KAK0556061.1 hypothetical protein OC846_001390 [Tilletia horrida]KAK0560590.1 hypothetical protein OC861_006217 [Tilletia horrida]
MPDVSAQSRPASASAVPATTDEEEQTPPSSLALKLTSFQRWYPFHRSHAPRATVINLSEVQPEFIPWLESGSFVLPDDPAEAETSSSSTGPSRSREWETAPDEAVTAPEPVPVPAQSEGQGDEDQSEDSSDEADALPAPTFPALHARLLQIIQKYDGAIFPKLNWSAPRDAAWIVPGATLRCTNPQDIYLLLKSSDFVATDIAQARELYLEPSPTSITADMEAMALQRRQQHQTSSPPLYLVIKQHYAFPTSHEFRCFVHRRRFIAISQRDTATAFPHLQPAAARRTIRKLITNFWKERIHHPSPPSSTSAAEGQTSQQGDQPAPTTEADHEADSRVPPTALLRDYVFDVYLTRDMGRVFLVDLAPWGIARTDPLLWEWDELERLSARRHARERGLESPNQEQEGDEDIGEEDDDAEDEEEDDDDALPLPPLRILISDPSNDATGADDASAMATSTRLFNTPTYAHNMVPADFHALASASMGQDGASKTLEELRDEWAAAVARASVD